MIQLLGAPYILNHLNNIFKHIHKVLINDFFPVTFEDNLSPAKILQQKPRQAFLTAILQVTFQVLEILFFCLKNCNIVIQCILELM